MDGVDEWKALVSKQQPNDATGNTLLHDEACCLDDGPDASSDRQPHCDDKADRDLLAVADWRLK